MIKLFPSRADWGKATFAQKIALWSIIACELFTIIIAIWWLVDPGR